MKVIASGKTDKFVYTLKLSDERLKLFIDISQIQHSVSNQSDTSSTTSAEAPVVYHTITKEEILAILPKDVWDGCIHHEVIEHIAKEVSHGSKIEERRVAKGTAPIDGTDGRFVLTVKKMSPNVEIHQDEKGYIDFKDLHRFENVRAGTIVAKIFPAKLGTAGTDPLGKTIAAKAGQAIKISHDDSLKIQEHSEGGGQDLIACIDGFLSDDNGKLSIQQELRISGAIDYKVGSIDFVGNVIIQGDVLPGFVVRGRKGVLIRGSVQEATVCSAEGSVEISGHCMGSRTTKIEAKNQISISVANQVEAQAGISLNIVKEARDCQLRSGGTITATKAAIIGGALYCACGVEARELGARGGSTTNISLSSDIAMTREFAEVTKLINDHEKILVLLKAHLGPIAKTEAGLSSLDSKHRERLMPIILKKRAVEASLSELKLKREELLSAAHTNHLFRVNFIEKIHSGVNVKVGEESFEVKEDMLGPKSLTYIVEKKAFEIGDLAALECSIIEQNKENGNDGKRSKH